MSEVSMAEALQQFLKKSKLKTGVQALQIEDVWERIMGKTVAKYTEKLKNGNLIRVIVKIFFRIKDAKVDRYHFIVFKITVKPRGIKA